MLVICAGGMRTGSIACYQLIRELLQVTGKGWAPQMGTGVAPDIIAAHAKREEWVLYKSHGTSLLWQPHADRLRAVVTYRNQLDVIVSLMKFRDESFNKIVKNSDAFYSNINAVEEWIDFEHSYYPLLIPYEKGIIANRASTVQRIAAHLDLDIPDKEDAQKIADKWSIESNVMRAEDGHPVNSHDYMARRHIYSYGQSKWRDELTEEQITAVLAKERIARWQEEMGYHNES